MSFFFFFLDGAAITATMLLPKLRIIGASQRCWKHIRAKVGTIKPLQRCPLLAPLGCDIILSRRWKLESERQVTKAAVRLVQCDPHINNSPHQNNREQQSRVGG